MAQAEGNKAQIALMLNDLRGMAKSKTPLSVDYFTHIEGESRPEDVLLTWGLVTLTIDYTQQTARLNKGGDSISWGAQDDNYMKCWPPGKFNDPLVLPYIMDAIRGALGSVDDAAKKFNILPLFKPIYKHSSPDQQYPPYSTLEDLLGKLAYFRPTSSARVISDDCKLSELRVALGIYDVVDLSGPYLKLQTALIRGEQSDFTLTRTDSGFDIVGNPGEWMVFTNSSRKLPGDVSFVNYGETTEIPVSENQALLRLPDPEGLSWLAWKPVRYDFDQGDFVPTR